MEGNTFSDSESSEYEDIYLVLDIKETAGLDFNNLPPFKLQQMDTQTPVLTIGDYRFEGRLEPVVGTYAIFSNSENKGPDLVCSATETIVFDKAQRVMEIESDNDSGCNNNSNSNSDNENNIDIEETKGKNVSKQGNDEVGTRKEKRKTQPSTTAAPKRPNLRKKLKSSSRSMPTRTSPRRKAQ